MKKSLALVAALSFFAATTPSTTQAPLDVNPNEARSDLYQKLLACALHLQESLDQVQYFLRQERENELPSMQRFWLSSAEFWADNTQRCAEDYIFD